VLRAQILRHRSLTMALLNLPVALVGHPVANRLLKRVRDYAQVKAAETSITQEVTELFQVDLRFGLD